MSDAIEHDIEDEYEVVNFIMLRRLNDTMMFLLREMNPEAANHLAGLHEKGIFVSPPPAWNPGEDQYDEPTDGTPSVDKE